jgi:hypothetical protein
VAQVLGDEAAVAGRLAKPRGRGVAQRVRGDVLCEARACGGPADNLGEDVGSEAPATRAAEHGSSPRCPSRWQSSSKTSLRPLGEPVATVATQIVRQHLEMTRNGSSTPKTGASAPAALGKISSGRPPWLRPYGGDREWSELMWGSILALHGRYPRVLGHLKDGWWNDAAHVETLCALVVWRDWLDESGRDPREELAFQFQLYNFGRSLRQEGGGVTKASKPGVAPTDWTS